MRDRGRATEASGEKVYALSTPYKNRLLKGETGAAVGRRLNSPRTSRRWCGCTPGGQRPRNGTSWSAPRRRSCSSTGEGRGRRAGGSGPPGCGGRRCRVDQPVVGDGRRATGGGVSARTRAEQRRAADCLQPT